MNNTNNTNNMNNTNDILTYFNLPKIKKINKSKQAFALILMNGKYVLLVLAFLLLMPYNTPLTSKHTKIIYPTWEIAVLSTLFLIACFLAMWGWGLVLYQMTYKDVIKTIEKAEANRLFSSELAETLIALVWRAKELREEEENVKKKRTIKQYQEMLNKKGFDINIESLLEKNAALQKELEQYTEIKQIIEEDVNANE